MVDDSRRAATPLCISGGNTKAFYGRSTRGMSCDVSGHRGVIAYEPTELVITARGGTPLREIEALLHDHGQMLPFEPPHFAASATLGGSVAAGLAGPRRPYAGAVRDFVLGVKYINGQGEVLSCGGQVMKNVAGYDISRLMAGSLGTLGILLEVSVKVLPRPAQELTLRLEMDTEQAIATMNRWAGQPLPLSAACLLGGVVYVRLSGTEAGVRAAAGKIGGDVMDNDGAFWHELKEQQLPFFQSSQPLWRISLAPGTPPLTLPGAELIDWGGAQRWLCSDAPAPKVREQAQRAGGHATVFRGGDRHGEVFHPLPEAMMAFHRRLKKAFDPYGIFNPGRMYPDL